MRINKKYVPKRFLKREYSRYDEVVREYVDLDSVSSAIINFVFFVFMGGMIVFLIWAFHTVATTSPEEEAKYQSQCDVVSGGQPHFLSRNPEQSRDNFQCVVAPDWRRIDL